MGRMMFWKRSLRILEHDKILSLIGLAMRGRNLVSGEFQTKAAVQNGSAMLVVIAQDASQNTKKLFHDKCDSYQVPIYEYGTKATLGQAMGKEFRSSMAVCDAGLANAIRKHLEEV